MFQYLVTPAISRRIRELARDREELIAVISNLHNDIRNQYAQLRERRNPAYPDCFDYLYRRYTAVAGWRTFRFLVNDVQAPGFVMVESVSAT